MEEDAIYSQAAGKTLDTFNDLILIDNFAKTYKYTHEEVFALDWEFVYSLMYVHAQQAHIDRKAAKIRKNMKKL